MKLFNQEQIKLLTAAFQTVIYLFLFLIVSFLSSYLDLKENQNNETTFQSQFEKYIVLAIGLYMAIPFSLSNLLTMSILLKGEALAKVWLKSSIGTSIIAVLVALGSGIFIVIKGTGYVGYSLIGGGVLFGAFSGYYCYVGYKILKEPTGSSNVSPRNSDPEDDENNNNSSRDSD